MIVLCATNRPGANSRKVARHAHALLEGAIERDRTTLGEIGPVQFMDLADLKPDIFDPACYGKKPEWFLTDFQKPISEAKGILIVTPEYNGSFPGVLKYFIDMLKFPESLVNVPVAVVGVAMGQFGALRAVEQLQMILHYRKVHLFGERLFVPAIHEEVSDSGELKAQEERLVALVEQFAKFAATLGQAPA